MLFYQIGFLLLLSGFHAMADCTVFHLKDCEIDSIGTLPNGKPIYQYICKQYIGFNHYEYLSILATDRKSIPDSIKYCSNEEYYFSTSTGVIQPNEFGQFEIIDLFHFHDGTITSSTFLEGQLLTTNINRHDIYGRSNVSSSITIRSWDQSTKRYLIIEEKEVDTEAVELSRIEHELEIENLDNLFSRLKEFDFGGSFGTPLVRLPSSISSQVWKLTHKKALLEYKNGNREAAANLVNKLMLSIDVEVQDERREEFKQNQSDYNYAIDILLEDNSLIDEISDCAFFLEQADLALNEAIFIFKNILKIDPNRVVTYLNLADALWKKNREEEAIASYSEYAELMRAGNMEDKIPGYVLERLN